MNIIIKVSVNMTDAKHDRKILLPEFIQYYILDAKVIVTGPFD